MSTLSLSLTGEQVDQYFDRIQLPQSYRRAAAPTLGNDLLSAIQLCHVTSIPYENLSLHYTDKVHVSLNITNIHAKLVGSPRGGYCMENNILFYHVLRFLGFDVYMAGARLLRDSGAWTGWEHAVNIVTFADGTRYLADVGYGGNGPKCPLPLISGTPLQNIGTQSVQLVYGPMPSNHVSRQDVWSFQFRNASDQAWKTAYSFPGTEFFPEDFEVMNFFTSCSPSSFLTSHILVVKFLRENDNAIGKVVLDDDKIKRNLGGKNEVVQTLFSEKERIEALENYFGIRLTDSQKEGIGSRPSALARGGTS